MDTKKLASIVEETPLTDESKNMIYQLLPQADDPAIQQQILEIMSAEADENRHLAEEVNEMRVAMEMGEREIADIEERTNEKVLEQYEDLGEKLDDLQGSMAEEAESAVEEPVEEKPMEQAQAVEQPVQPIVQQPTQQPDQQPAQQTYQQTPQWNQSYQASEQTSPTQPAPFPGSQNQY